jgi:hypothetical protein
MSHFAKVENGIVTQVIVAEEDFIATGAVGHGWVQTSYNTLGNQHPEGRPLRGNYAGIGFTYDEVNDVFIAPKPFENWILNGNWLWEPPIPMPQDAYFYKWDQEATAWVQGDLRPIPEPIPEPVVEAPVEAVVEPEAVVETPVEVPAEVVVETPVSAVEVVTPVEPEVIIDASAPADTATASTPKG